MARLPIPSSDDGTWGDILNDFLTQVHTASGTLKDNSVPTAAVQDSAITEVKLSSAVQTKLNGVGGVSSVNTRTGAVTLTAADVGLANVDNTSDANKPVSSATQTALNAKAALSHAHVSSDVSDFTEATQDVIGSTLVAGTNASIIYNDAAGTVTIASTGNGTTNLTASRTSTDVTVLSDTGTDATLSAADASNAGVMSAADKTKLNGVASGATANSADATLLDRANHTGAQAISTVTNLQTSLDGKVDENVTISADQAAPGWWQHLLINYAPATTAPESFFVESNASGTVYRVFWLNENGLPRSAASKTGEVPVKIHGFQGGGQAANLTEWWTKWSGSGKNLLYGIDQNGKPVIGLGSGTNSTTGAHTIVLAAADPVPSGLPAGTVIIRTS